MLVCKWENQDSSVSFMQEQALDTGIKLNTMMQ